MAAKSWVCGYQNLLSMADITTLESRSLCMLFKIIHYLYAFPQNMISKKFPEAVINLPLQQFNRTFSIYIS